MKDNRVYLRHILDAIGHIAEYVGSMSYVEFVGNGMAVAAVVRECEIIGEAARRVDEEFKKNHPLPWVQMIGMRNKLIHEYFNVDTEMVWRTCKKDIPQLAEKIAAILLE